MSCLSTFSIPARVVESLKTFHQHVAQSPTLILHMKQIEFQTLKEAPINVDDITFENFDNESDFSMNAFVDIATSIPFSSTQLEAAIL